MAERSIELGHMEHHTLAVALRSDEACKAVLASELELSDLFRDLAQRTRLDFDRHLAARCSRASPTRSGTAVPPRNRW